MRFSLVVMTYQRPEALRRCLDSIARLSYDRDAFEVIVVDDGSAERPPVPLAEAYPDLRLRYEWIRHQGVAAARNAGLALAQAELVAFLADDYILPPDYLARAERFFQDYPDAQVITFNVRSVGPGLGCQVQQLYHELVLLQNAAAEPDRNGLIRTFKLPASRAAVFRRELLTQVGGFDPRLPAGEDGELGQRLAARGVPLYFMHRYYIDHHEGKGFGDFLRQRREYATSYFAVTAASRVDAAGLTLDPRPLHPGGGRAAPRLGGPQPAGREAAEVRAALARSRAVPPPLLSHAASARAGGSPCPGRRLAAVARAGEVGRRPRVIRQC